MIAKIALVVAVLLVAMLASWILLLLSPRLHKEFVIWSAAFFLVLAVVAVGRWLVWLVLGL